MGIRACGSADLSRLHPVFRARLDALADDPRLENRLCVVSGVRTYDEQRYLYQCYLTKQCNNGNLAANPDAPITPHYDVDRGRGSWHMEQISTVYGLSGYAVDVNHSALPWDVSMLLSQVAAEYLLDFPVYGEPWHIQMVYSDWTTMPELPKPPEPEPELAPAYVAAVDN